MKIVLLGYMGSGKSTIGKEISQLKKSEFVDLDSYIEKREGLSIPEIFAHKGELHFRKKEGEYLIEILSTKEDIVLATGGGTPCYGNNMKEILDLTENVFYLKLSIVSLVNRLKLEKESRPLIKNLSEDQLPEFIGKHLFERSFFYNQANISVDCDNKTPQEIAQLITEKLV